MTEARVERRRESHRASHLVFTGIRERMSTQHAADDIFVYTTSMSKDEYDDVAVCLFSQTSRPLNWILLYKKEKHKIYT